LCAADPLPERPFLKKLSPADWPSFSDDDGLKDLAESCRQSLSYYNTLPPDREFLFGNDRLSVSHMIDTFETLLTLLGDSSPDFRAALEKQFDVYRADGPAPSRDVTFTAYYEHTLDASLSPTAEYRFPLYRRPPDLMELPATSAGGITVGRKNETGEFVPYYSRAEIDTEKILADRGLEIAWAKDPLEIYFLQVQGSGWLQLPRGDRLRIRYQANNGHPYRSIGTFLIERGLLPKENFSRAVMAAYLRNHPDQRQDILNQNPRYVFFEIDRGPQSRHALGSLRVPLTAKRSIATDPQLFPKGALAWMEIEGDDPVRRFVLNQDEGGAIKGPGRVDYFVGEGPEAETYAQRFYRRGKLYLLVKKKRS